MDQLVRMIKKLIIRTDSSVTIGTGHVMRMIALAQAWKKRDGQVTFACAEITPSLEERIVKEGFELKQIEAEPGTLKDLNKTCAMISALQDTKNCLVALDGYRFDSDFQLRLNKSGYRLMVMDDYGHAEFYHTDWLLNQNISAREDLYPNRSPETKLLLGTQYALLREDFLKYRGWKRKNPEVAKKILVTLGGSDPDNVTQEVIEALKDLDIEAKILVGGSNPHIECLRNIVEQNKQCKDSIELIVNASNMPELMAWSDMAVAAGGSTAWELSFMGVPSVFLVLADNQRDISLALELGQMGLSFDVGKEDMEIQLPNLIRMLISDQSLRKQFSANAAKAVDGFGAERVCDLLS